LKLIKLYEKECNLKKSGHRVRNEKNLRGRPPASIDVSALYGSGNDRLWIHAEKKWIMGMGRREGPRLQSATHATAMDWDQKEKRLERIGQVPIRLQH